MKNLIVKLAICFLVTMNTFSQTSHEKAVFNSINNRINSKIHVSSKNYFVFSLRNNYFLVEKSKKNKMHKYWFTDGLVDSLFIDSSFISKNFFSNFKPKPNVNRYVSETKNGSKCPSHMIYFAIYEKGKKTFESWLPTLLLCDRSGEVADIDFPYNDEILWFFVEHSLY